jgi:hypothetical protein
MANGETMTEPELITPDDLRAVADEWGEQKIQCDDLLRNAAHTIAALTSALEHRTAEWVKMVNELNALRTELGVPEAVTLPNLVRSLAGQRDAARAGLTLCNDRVTELKTALDFQRESYGGAAGDAFDAIAILCGCEQWDYPGQLVRDVERLRAERDQARVMLLQCGKTRSAYQDERDVARLDLEEAEAQLATALQQCAKGAAERKQLAAALDRIMDTCDSSSSIYTIASAALATDAPASPERCPHGTLPREGCAYLDCAYCLAFRASPERGTGGEATCDCWAAEGCGDHGGRCGKPGAVDCMLPGWPDSIMLCPACTPEGTNTLHNAGSALEKP